MKIFNSPESDKRIIYRFFKRLLIALILFYPLLLITIQMHRWLGDKTTMKGYNDQKIEREMPFFYFGAAFMSLGLAFIKEESK